MATLQSFDSEIEKTRKIVSEMRGKIEQSGVVLDTLAKSDSKLVGQDFDIENARISDVLNQQKVMEANIADLIIGLEEGYEGEIALAADAPASPPLLGPIMARLPCARTRPR